MRGMLGLLMAAAAIILFYVAFRPKTTDKPNVKAPDVNSAAKHAKDAGDATADQVATWSATTWKMIAILVIALIAIYVWNKYKPLRWIMLGVAVTAIAITVRTGG